MLKFIPFFLFVYSASALGQCHGEIKAIEYAKTFIANRDKAIADLRLTINAEQTDRTTRLLQDKLQKQEEIDELQRLTDFMKEANAFLTELEPLLLDVLKNQDLDKLLDTRMSEFLMAHPESTVATVYLLTIESAQVKIPKETYKQLASLGTLLASYESNSKKWSSEMQDFRAQAPGRESKPFISLLKRSLQLREEAQVNIVRGHSRIAAKKISLGQAEKKIAESSARETVWIKQIADNEAEIEAQSARLPHLESERAACSYRSQKSEPKSKYN